MQSIYVLGVVKEKHLDHNQENNSLSLYLCFVPSLNCVNASIEYSGHIIYGKNDERMAKRNLIVASYAKDDA